MCKKKTEPWGKQKKNRENKMQNLYIPFSLVIL